ncbi:unnamed protein product [Dicrocoelium dendriticum]|nr:unnamed protein product [Dicrocoelium dendriticum]
MIASYFPNFKHETSDGARKLTCLTKECHIAKTEGDTFELVDTTDVIEDFGMGSVHRPSRNLPQIMDSMSPSHAFAGLACRGIKSEPQSSSGLCELYSTASKRRVCHESLVCQVEHECAIENEPQNSSGLCELYSTASKRRVCHESLVCQVEHECAIENEPSSWTGYSDDTGATNTPQQLASTESADTDEPSSSGGITNGVISS